MNSLCSCKTIPLSLPVLVAFQGNAQFDGDDVHKATNIHLQMDVATMLKALPADATVYAKNESELDTAAGITDSLRSISADVKFTGDTVTDNSPGVNGEISSAEGQILRGSDAVQIAEVESAGGGKLTLKLSDGSTADASELSFSDVGEQELWRVIASSMESVLNDGRVLELLDDIEVKDQSLYEKVRSFIEDVAALVYETIQVYRDLKPDSPEGRIVQRMQGIHEQLRQVFAEGLHEGGENYRQGGKENTTQEGGVRYSITEPFVDVNGTHFDSAVLLDTTFFDGINPRNWGRKLRDFVQMRAATDPLILPVADENGNVQQLQFANPQDRVTKNGQSNHKVLDELSSSSDNISKLAVIHIDEIVEVSDADVPYHTTDNNNQWLDQNGWLHRTANVINTKNGNIYNLTIDIAKTKDGRHILYATNGKIKRVGNVQVNSLTIRGSGQNSNSNSNIAQTGSTVKPESINTTETQQFKQWFGDWQNHPD